MTVRDLIGILALIVSAQYLVIAFAIVPRLARLAQTHGRLLSVARWGAAAFFIGCAVTHVAIAAANLLPADDSLGMADMGSIGSPSAQLATMVVTHVAQIVGGALFIVISRTHLEVSILSKASAQEQRALDRQFRSAFDEAPLGIALLPMPGTADPSDAYVNPAYLKMFGLADAGGGTSYPLAALDPAERVDAEAAIARIADGETVEQHLHVAQATGETRLIRATLSPVADDSSGWRRMTGIFEDITERAAAAAELQAREERFRQLAEGIGVGINLRQVDPPEFLYSNSAYLEIVGMEGQDLDGAVETLLDRLHPDDLPAFMDGYWDDVAHGRRGTAEVRMILPDGAVRWLRAVSKPISVNQVATTVEDITSSKVADAAIRSAKAEAEAANLAKSEFLSRMSHELRTPLNAVLGFAQILELGTLTDKQGEAVTHILGGGRHLLGMIDDILDISRIETDQLDVSLEPVRADEVIAEAVALIRPMAAGHHITLSAGAAADGAVGVVRADRRRLRQVLLNLLSNAVKYNRPGGSVRVTCSVSDDAHLSIDVTDTGIGIRDADLARVFLPFDRLGQQVTDIEGTGIGLALSQRLAAIMGGRLDVVSTYGVGSTFTVALPVAVAHPDPTFVDSPPADAPTRGPLTTSTLLYVEDNPPNVRLMQALVDRRPGWEMVHAGHGSLGWELATSLRPSLILLDLHLPDMNGLDLLQRLRTDPRTADTRIVIVSADANEHQIQRLIDAGADRYLTKPLDVTHTLALLDEYSHEATSSAKR